MPKAAGCARMAAGRAARLQVSSAAATAHNFETKLFKKESVTIAGETE